MTPQWPADMKVPTLEVERPSTADKLEADIARLRRTTYAVGPDPYKRPPKDRAAVLQIEKLEVELAEAWEASADRAIARLDAAVAETQAVLAEVKAEWERCLVVQERMAAWEARVGGLAEHGHRARQAAASARASKRNVQAETQKEIAKLDASERYAQARA